MKQRTTQTGVGTYLERFTALHSGALVDRGGLFARLLHVVGRTVTLNVPRAFVSGGSLRRGYGVARCGRLVVTAEGDLLSLR